MYVNHSWLNEGNKVKILLPIGDLDIGDIAEVEHVEFDGTYDFSHGYQGVKYVTLVVSDGWFKKRRAVLEVNLYVTDKASGIELITDW